MTCVTDIGFSLVPVTDIGSMPVTDIGFSACDRYRV